MICIFPYFCGVKRFVAIFFLFLSLSSNPFVAELLYIPTLLHHYSEHKALDKNTSFFDFLSVHYSNQINHPDDEHHDHEKLPYKKADKHLFSVVSLKSVLFFSLKVIQFNVLKIHNLNYQTSNCVSGFISSIWQPPKFS